MNLFTKVFQIALVFFLLGATNIWAQEILYVSPGGAGNVSGSDWDNAADNIFEAANTATSETEIIIYVKEGTYTGSRGTVSGDSNMPNDKNVTIIGGYDTSLTGTDLCAADGSTYNPNVNPVIIKTDGTDNTRTWFWMTNSDGNLTVRGVTFDNPDNLNAGQGTVLYVAGGTKVYTFEDVFITNSDGDIGRGPFLIGASADGATLNLTRVTVRNDANGGLDEGDVVLNFGNNTKNCVVNVTDCYFSNIIEPSFECAGLYLRGDSGHTANVTGTTFCSLKATGGSAIRVDGSHTANITDCKFIGGLTNVSGQDGAAIALANQATATVSSSVFYNNKAEGDAGAINVGSGSTLTSTGNHYENNQGSAAGAIKINASTFTSTNDVFKENFCWGGSGGGGAIKIEDNENGGNGTIDASITGASFCSNYARFGDGGAIDFENTAQSVKIENSDFKNNNSNGGGAIKMLGSDVEVINCNFEGNQTGSINSSGSITDISGEGGAIYVENCAIKLSGSSFKANRSDRGGAISIDDNDGSPIFPTYREIIENSVFWENVAEQQGGGAIHSIRVTGGFSLTGSTFTNNEALRRNGANGGGAIRVDGVCCINTDVYNNFDNNSFTGNLCDGSTTRANGNGGSDIKTYYGRVLGISNSKMQLGGQGNYPTSDFTFGSGNTFGNTDQGTAATTIADCTANQPTCSDPTGPLPAENETCITGTDYGDLPSGYPVVYANMVNEGITVWAGIDAPTNETSNQPSSDASADANDDGLAITQKAPPGGGIMKITVTGNSSAATTVYYSVGFDWDGNKMFEGSEVYTGSIMTASPATTPEIDVTVPASFSDGDVINTRLVVATSATDASTGATADGSFLNGEVEDSQFTSNQVLPVRLSSFEVSSVRNDAKLSWTTASELDNDYFHIQRSADGQYFETIGKIQGNGTTSTESSYSFTDRNIGKLNGEVYYRLKQVDYNGKSELSHIVSTRFDLRSDSKVYPNPVYNRLKIHTGKYKGDVTVNLLDVSGRMIISKTISNRDIMLDDVREGYYKILVYNNAGELLVSEGLVVIK